MYKSDLRRQQKEKTRALILEAARRLFAEHPYDEVSMRLVGREADRTAGSVTRLYETKERLWRAAMGTAPPRDRKNVRYADELEAVLRALVIACRTDSGDLESVLSQADMLLNQLD